MTASPLGTEALQEVSKAKQLRVVKICAGAGGQALGLEKAGFEHELAVELDPTACDTFEGIGLDEVAEPGDVANLRIWDPADYRGIDLLAGGVPCPRSHCGPGS